MPYQPEQPQQGKYTFVVSSVATVIGGIALLGLAIFYFRAKPAPQVKAPPPKMIEKIVKVVEPAPPPKIVYQEKVIEKIIEVLKPVPAPPPPPPPVVEPNPWVGVWKTAKEALPMIDLRERNEEYFGVFAPQDWSGTYGFKGGTRRDDMVEFQVETPLFKVPQQIRMKKQASGAVQVETWFKPQDAVSLLTSGVMIAKSNPVTPAQKAQLKNTIDREIKRLGTPVQLGMFSRVRDPGDDTPVIIVVPKKTPPTKQPQRPVAPAGVAATKR